MTRSKLQQSDEVDALLGKLVEDYLRQLDLGNEPDIEQYAEDHPEIAPLVRQAFPALKLVGRSESDADSAHGIDLSRSKQLGDFRLIRELGSGGMGYVYEAEQLSMGRNVALKILPLAGALQQKAVARFRNEVRAAASLDHPNIVSVYSVGEERGVHYYAMQLIHGQTMAALIRELSQLRTDDPSLSASFISEFLSAGAKKHLSRGNTEPTQELPASIGSSEKHSPETKSEVPGRVTTVSQTNQDTLFFESAARLGIQAAEALQHAHDQGVVHRDIKPANLMLDADMQLYITDFGLARIESDVGVTMTGDLVGTLRYMSPEQALANRIVIDHRSDVYSLGVTLYELITLRPAFDGQDRQELLKQIAFEEPPKPRRINRALPADFETVVLKAIEKNPDDRYSTAQELADDLQRFLDHVPVKAKPPSLRTRLTKWSRRHHETVLAAAACLAIAAVVAVIGSAVIFKSYRELQNQRQDVVDAYQLSAELRAGQVESTGGLRSPRRMVFGPDGVMYVSSANNDSVLKFSADSGEFLGVLVTKGSGGLGHPIGLRLAPNGELLVASANDDRVLRYGSEDGEFLGVLVSADIEELDRPTDLLLRDDGFLYVTSDRGSVLRFNARDGKLHDRFIEDVRGPRALLFGPDERCYVCSYLDHRVLRFTYDGEFVGEAVEEHELMVGPTALAFGPDGNLYVGCDRSSCVLRFDRQSGKFIDVFVKPRSRGLHGVADIEFRDDGHLYVCSRNSSEILRFDSYTGEFVDEFISEKASTATASELLLLAITLWHLDEKEEARRQYERAVDQLSKSHRRSPQMERLRKKAKSLIDEQRNR